MAEAFELWQAKLDESGGDMSAALSALGVDPGRCELLARARSESRDPELEAQLEYAFCWMSGVGMAAAASDGKAGDLSDALAATLAELDGQGIGELARSLGIEASDISEQAMLCALNSGGQVPPGEKAASCAEGMLVGLTACRQDAQVGRRSAGQ